VLPPGKSWTSEIEMWGAEDGDRIEVVVDPGSPPVLLARFDLRQWKPALYDAFLSLVEHLGGRLERAEEGTEVQLSTDAFLQALRDSRAARFVNDQRHTSRS
jgi:hypothetical protein